MKQNSETGVAGPSLTVNFTIEETAATARRAQMDLFPNPLKIGDRELSISGFETRERTIETRVEIINMTGEVVFAERVSCTGKCGPYHQMKLNKQLVPGVYLVNMETNGRRSSRRLLVK